MDGLTGLNFDDGPGTMSNAEEKAADAALFVRFERRALPDLLRTEGGILHRRQQRALVEQLKKEGVELEPCEDDTVKGAKDYLVVPPAGRPMFKMVEFITILNPSKREYVCIRPVEEADRVRFRERYDAWKKGDEGQLVGTPLSELSFLNEAQREELKALRVLTAEQLVAQQGALFPGYENLRQRTRRFLEGASGNVHVEKLSREMEAKDAHIRALEQAVADMQRRLGLPELPVEGEAEQEAAPKTTQRKVRKH